MSHEHSPRYDERGRQWTLYQCVVRIFQTKKIPLIKFVI